MTTVLVFALTLLAAVLLSGLAERTVLFTAVLFLIVGIVAGSTGLVGLRPEDLLIVRLAELALSNLGLASARSASTLRAPTDAGAHGAAHPLRGRFVLAGGLPPRRVLRPTVRRLLESRAA